jgi:hypothetical protein
MDYLQRTPWEKFSIKNVSELSELQTPNFQRQSDCDHIKTIYNSLKKLINNGEEPKLPGCLTVLFDYDTEQSFLSDGNHRLESYRKILKNINHDLKVCVQQITTFSEEERICLFEQANNSIPVSILPQGVQRHRVQKIADYFYKKYKGVTNENMFKNSVKGGANRPHINMRTFEAYIGKLLHVGFESQHIITKIENLNTKLLSKTVKYFNDIKKETSKGGMKGWLEKTQKCNNFRLGLIVFNNDYSALDNVFDQEMKEEPIREKISKQLRNNVWTLNCGITNNSMCPFCKKNMTKDNFHVSHDIPHIKGGESTVENLFPCCSSCNLKMGTNTKVEYEEMMKYM